MKKYANGAVFISKETLELIESLKKSEDDITDARRTQKLMYEKLMYEKLQMVDLSNATYNEEKLKEIGFFESVVLNYGVFNKIAQKCGFIAENV